MKHINYDDMQPIPAWNKFTIYLGFQHGNNYTDTESFEK